MAARALTSMSVAELLEAIASAEPTPGGGSASALAAAVAAGLVAMVCRLTLGRDRFAEFQGEAESILAEADRLRALLTSAIDSDAVAFQSVMGALRLPRSTDDETAARRAAVAEATRAATIEPLVVAEACSAVLALCERAVGRINPNASSDVIVAASLASAAMAGAAANVETNLASLEPDQFAWMVRERLEHARSGRAERVEAIIAAACA